ncbi:hypothetical protein A359_00690 [secondary endosymbiont of Ctenarytaina eucalypti]|uniref:Uncharacterized protein n=1 Tax=secondary endosymbiont of Ctenarytaina eucalypti TaxID=1199245 RepID=J3Z2Q0_9ENTR|nr:hypothetical protein A359_00690 [secondary endosymbiont of Ctenarytaina eucalypti]
MSILINKNITVIVQLFIQRYSVFHFKQALAYGTKILGGITLGETFDRTSEFAGF